MKYHNLEELKDKIAKEWGVEELLDALGMDMFDLVESLSESIEENADKLESLL